MGTQAFTRRVLPKRKRKETSYYPTDSEASETDVDEEVIRGLEIDVVPHSKKVKVSAAVRSTKPLPKKKIFPFMSLPPELKNKIYSYVLTSDHEVPIIWRLRQYRHTAALGDTDTFQSFYRRRRWGILSPPAKEWPKPCFGPNILLLNRQIQAETLPILYRANSFAFEDTRAMHAFCANIGPKNCALLRQLSLKQMGYTKSCKALNNPAFAMLGSAVNLTRLSMDCHVHYSGCATSCARQFYRDGHHWLEAVGCSKGRRDAAVDIIELGAPNIWRSDYSDDEDLRAKLLALTASFRTALRKMLQA